MGHRCRVGDPCRLRALVEQSGGRGPGPETSISASHPESSSPIISESPFDAGPRGRARRHPRTPPVNPVTPELQMEMDLDALGLPTGKVDGYVNASTRRALCAYRDLNGLGATRGQPGTALMSKISSSSDLPLLPETVRREGTGEPDLPDRLHHEQRPGTSCASCRSARVRTTGTTRPAAASKRVYWKYNGWQAGSLFPEPTAGPGCTGPSTSTRDRVPRCASP